LQEIGKQLINYANTVLLDKGKKHGHPSANVKKKVATLYHTFLPVCCTPIRNI